MPYTMKEFQQEGCDPADARKTAGLTREIGVGENGFPAHAGMKLVGPNQYGGKPMIYDTWMAEVLARAGVAEEVDRVLREKNDGVAGGARVSARGEASA
jgi:hypothetical protein